MRPVSLAVPTTPHPTIGSSDEQVYVWQVVCDDGQTKQGVVRVPRTVIDTAHADPEACGPGIVEAVCDSGAAVIRAMVLGRDDPPLDWVVHRSAIVEDSTPLTDGSP